MVVSMSDHLGFVERLSPHLLWDVDRRKIDPESHADFLICRIMERGRSEEVRLAWNYYGEDRVKEALLAPRSLSPKTIQFFAHQFGIPRTAFRAYQRSQNWAV